MATNWWHIDLLDPPPPSTLMLSLLPSSKLTYSSPPSQKYWIVIPGILIEVTYRQPWMGKGGFRSMIHGMVLIITTVVLFNDSWHGIDNKSTVVLCNTSMINRTVQTRFSSYFWCRLLIFRENLHYSLIHSRRLTLKPHELLHHQKLHSQIAPKKCMKQ